MPTSHHPWHREDIKAALRKSGNSMAAIARRLHVSEGTIRMALNRPSFFGEQAIARSLGLPAHELWPHRYSREGAPLHRFPPPHPQGQI